MNRRCRYGTEKNGQCGCELQSADKGVQVSWDSMGGWFPTIVSSYMQHTQLVWEEYERDTDR